MGNIFGILIVRPFGMILMAIYNIVQSYGLAVIVFAVLCKLLMLPLSYKSKKSMLKMSALNAEMQKLQKKYANNRTKLNDEMQRLYEKHGVSPTGGCLTNFITLPIMMALYYAVQQPLTYMMGLYTEDISALANLCAVDMSQSSYTVQITIAEALNSFVEVGGQFSAQVTGLTENIANFLVPLDFNFLGINLSQTPSFSEPSLLWLIPILSGATALLSTVVMQKMQGNQNQLQGAMKTTMYLMPLMSVYFGFILPSSIGIYWIVSNIFMMLQEVLLTTIIRKRHPATPVIEGKKKNKEEA